jgi:signal transduction histidine kinase/ligand-binding sensor domain-containing protein
MRVARECVLSVALLTASALCARAAEAPRLLSGYSVTSWTDADGLPFGAVYAIVQDASGYLWVGTNAGLLRFDGVRFTPWNAISHDPLPISPVSALALGSDGTLWVGLTNDGGVYRLQGDRAEKIDSATPLHGTVMALVRDSQQTLWVVADNVLYRLSGSGWEVVKFKDEVDPRKTNLFLSSNGSLLVGSVGGLFQRVAETGEFHKLTGDWVWSASEDRSGTWWVTDTLAGFRRIDGTPHAERGFERNGYRLTHDRNGNLWVATIGEGLWRVRDSSHSTEIEKAALSTGLLSDSVQSLFEDREGNMWVGTTVGLHRLTRQKLTPLANVGLVVIADATGSDDIWVGTNYGLARFHEINGEWRPSRLRSPNIYVRALHRDRQGTLWAGTHEGFLFSVAKNSDTLVRVPLPPALERVPVVSITSERSGGLWLGDGFRLFHWNGTTLAPFQRPANAPAAGILFAYNDRKDRLWLAFHDGSVGVLQRNGTFRVYSREQFGPNGTVINSVAEDVAHDALWLATSSGVSRIIDDRVERAAGNSGLPGTRVWSVAYDRSGYVWASVDLGAVRFSSTEFDKAVSTPSHRLQYELFDPSDGLAGAPIMNVRSGQATDGKVWFIRGGALSVVDPRQASMATPLGPGTVRIEDARNEEHRFGVGANLAFPAGTRRIEIDYTALVLTFPNRVRFKYRLDGFDTDWVDAGTRRSASYTNLPPRAYTFRVAADTEDGTWHAPQATWRFTIRPRFVQTGWFYASTAAILALGLWGVWQFRVRLVRREYAMVLAERTRMSREIHDTLLQSLVGLALQLDVLGHSLEALSADARQSVTRMRRQVEAYIRDARQSIWNLRSQPLEAEDLVGALRGLGKRNTAGTAVRFTLTTTGEPRRVSGRTENELLRIAQEAVTNTMRHAKATRIDLDLRFDGTAVTLRVSDDGCGLAQPAPADRDTHFGIVSMRERAESLGGRFTIARSASGGTQVEAVLPIASAA